MTVSAGLTVGRLSALQVTAGNRAVSALVRGARRSPAVQRQVLTRLNVEPIDGGGHMVWDVVVGGRTPSPFPGTMGAHSTAWVAHIDEVRRYMVNLPIEESAENLLLLVADALRETAEGTKDSLYGMRKSLSEAHQTLLTTAKATLMTARDELQPLVDTYTPATDSVVLMARMRGLVSAYLTFVNYLPGATVKGGDPRGHGEGAARGDVAAFEYIYALSRRQKEATDNIGTEKSTDEAPLLEGALKELGSTGIGGLISAAAKVGFDRAQSPRLVTELTDKLWALFAVETPDIFAAQHRLPAATTWRPMVKNYLNVISRAYPYTFDFTEMHKPERQAAGLRSAIAKAGLAVDATVLDAVLTGLEADEVVEESAVRSLDQYAEVARTDIAQTGDAFQATVILAEGERTAGTELIGAVEMIGRTKSPFSGTMGAHSTAWKAHLDAMQRLLVGKSLNGAIDALVARGEEELKDQSLSLAHLVSEKQQYYLIWAFNTLRASIGQAPAAKTADSASKTGVVENLVKDLLTYVNFLPLSTVEKGGVPGGRSEAMHATFLRSYEELGAKAVPEHDRSRAKNLLQKHLWGMYDPGAAKDFPPELGERETTDFGGTGTKFGKKHPLHAKVFATDDSDPEVNSGIVLRRFLRTMQEAYPRSLADSGLLTEGGKSERSFEGESRQDVERSEGDTLRELVGQNNCLINAIALAASNGTATVSFDQMLRIRTRIGEIGTMLLATPRTIDIVCEVLGIARGVVVVYPVGTPPEDFGDTSHNPVIIKHTGEDHFVPYDPPVQDRDEIMAAAARKRSASTSAEVSPSKRKAPEAATKR